MNVSIYGSKIGYSSFEVVTRGFEEACEAHGCFAGVMDSTSVDLTSDMAGMLEADIAICTGVYPLVGWMNSIGSHKFAYVMLAPNSSWVPSAFWQQMEGQLTAVLTPSGWARDVLLESAPYEVDIIVVPHGILEGHGPVDELNSNCFKTDDRFRIAHFAGSSLERKGTYELIKAFGSWNHRSESLLALFVNPIEWKGVSEEVEAQGLEESVVVATRLNAPPQVLKHFYASADLVCQPSRAEGFGLIPLESLAAGTPVAITLVTGHLQYAVENETPIDGVIEIEAGPDAEVRYDPGGMAATVSPDAITYALDSAFNMHERFRAAAKRNSQSILEKHAWPKVTNGFFQKLKGMQNAS